MVIVIFFGGWLVINGFVDCVVVLGLVVMFV